MPKLQETLYSGYIGQGPKVEEFERKFGEYIGNQNVLALNSGTSALHLAYHLAGVKGGEVITTPMTCTATNMPILANGADIVWADIDPETGMLDPLDVERKITPRTRAITVVHWGGMPAELGELRRICDKHGIPLIEDAAHALGAEYAGRKIGNDTADYTCFGGATRITTRRGNVPIKDVLVGDEVLTSTGEWNPVLANLRRRYTGRWVSIKAGQARIAATAEHPIRVYRDGRDSWLPAQNVRQGDSVYCETKPCVECQLALVPYYGRLCVSCYAIANKSFAKKRKLQITKTVQTRASSRLVHHVNVVSPVMESYRSQGYRVIPLIYALPDFLALRDGCIVAVEVESATNVKLSKQGKYIPLQNDTYDDVIWHTKESVKPSVGRYAYEIVGSLARVPVSGVLFHEKAKARDVFNLTVANDPTFFARGVLVHNCFSLQAIKHITTIDGGILALRGSEEYKRGKLLRWYGIDRETERKDFRCEEDIKEWGYKFHMNDVAATIGLVQLERLDQIIERHRYIDWYYRTHLPSSVNLPVQTVNAKGSWWLYTLRVSSRLHFFSHMRDWKVQVSQVHARNDEHTAFAAYRRNLPGVDEFAAKMVCIPIHSKLDDLQLGHINAAVHAFENLYSMGL